MAKRSWWFSQEGDNFDNVAKTNVEKWQRTLGSSRKLEGDTRGK